MNDAKKSTIAWAIATLGLMILLLADSSGLRFRGAAELGASIAVVGFLAALILMFLPKLGDYKPREEAGSIKRSQV